MVINTIDLLLVFIGAVPAGTAAAVAAGLGESLFLELGVGGILIPVVFNC